MTAPAYNLVMLYNPGVLDVADFHQIREHVGAMAPDIDVFIEVNGKANPLFDLRRKVAGRPTLVFSPRPLREFRPVRGKIYCGRAIPKLAQMQLLKAGGVPVPDWKVIEPSTKLRPQRWGPVVIVKPVAWADSTRGRGISMMRTEDVRYRAPEDYSERHPGRKGPMIAQKFIDTGEYSEEFRVLTLFGEPLYAIKKKARVPRPPLDAPREMLERARVAVTTGETGRDAEVTYCFEPDVLAFAREIYRPLHNVPLQACDILRDVNDSRLYVLEINPGGNTWHFSSGGVSFQRIEGKLRQEQFGAFELAARLLVERTRAEAV